MTPRPVPRDSFRESGETNNRGQNFPFPSPMQHRPYNEGRPQEPVISALGLATGQLIYCPASRPLDPFSQAGPGYTAPVAIPAVAAALCSPLQEKGLAEGFLYCLPKQLARTKTSKALERQRHFMGYSKQQIDSAPRSHFFIFFLLPQG